MFDKLKCHDIFQGDGKYVVITADLMIWKTKCGANIKKLRWMYLARLQDVTKIYELSALGNLMIAFLPLSVTGPYSKSFTCQRSKACCQRDWTTADFQDLNSYYNSVDL